MDLAGSHLHHHLRRFTREPVKIAGVYVKPDVKKVPGKFSGNSFACQPETI